MQTGYKDKNGQDICVGDKVIENDYGYSGEIRQTKHGQLIVFWTDPRMPFGHTLPVTDLAFQMAEGGLEVIAD